MDIQNLTGKQNNQTCLTKMPENIRKYREQHETDFWSLFLAKYLTKPCFISMNALVNNNSAFFNVHNICLIQFHRRCSLHYEHKFFKAKKKSNSVEKCRHVNDKTLRFHAITDGQNSKCIASIQIHLCHSNISEVRQHLRFCLTAIKISTWNFKNWIQSVATHISLWKQSDFSN